jgi:hypothetical protein
MMEEVSSLPSWTLALTQGQQGCRSPVMGSQRFVFYLNLRHVYTHT